MTKLLVLRTGDGLLMCARVCVCFHTCLGERGHSLMHWDTWIYTTRLMCQCWMMCSDSVLSVLVKCFLSLFPLAFSDFNLYRASSDTIRHKQFCKCKIIILDCVCASPPRPLFLFLLFKLYFSLFAAKKFREKKQQHRPKTGGLTCNRHGSFF